MRTFLLSCFLGASTLTVNAQSYLKKENNQWIGCGYYGLGYGMSFNYSPPQAFDAAQIGWGMWNGTASIADKNGNLLFYSDGNIIWDRNHNVMLHGWDICNDGSPSAANYLYTNTLGLPTITSSFNYDGVAIIPAPGSSHKYYVFSIVDSLTYSNSPPYSVGYVGEQTWEGRLRCSIVDMDLNNGLGAVDTNFRSVIIADSMAGNLQVVTGEDCNYWLIGFGTTGDYKAFNITAAGIDTVPVISTPTLPLSPVCYELTTSPDRRKLVQTLGTEAQYCDFDPATGNVSGTVLIGAQECSSAAFSPNSSKLYLGGIIGIRQYDLAAPLPWPFTLLTVNNYTATEYDMPLRLGPDGIIYGMYVTSENWQGYWAGIHIQQPDLTGVACMMDTFPNAPLIICSFFSMQLPNEVAVLVYDTGSLSREVPLCFEDTSVLLHPVGAPGTDFHWRVNTGGPNYYPAGGDTATFVATIPGTYSVQYYTSQPCTFHQDTFIVKRVAFSLDLGKDRDHISCYGQPLTLQAELKNAQYQWQDSSTTDQYQANSSGLYWVNATKDGCTATDSVRILILDLRQQLGNDTLLCAEQQDAVLNLEALVPAGGSTLWSTGSTATQIQVRDSGLYWVQVTDSTCVGTDSILVDREYCACPILMPNAFSPNDDGLNDYFMPSVSNCLVSKYKLQIFNRFGQLVYVSYQHDKGWNGYYKGLPADVGTYMYRLQMTAGISNISLTRNGDFVLLR